MPPSASGASSHQSFTRLNSPMNAATWGASLLADVTVAPSSTTCGERTLVTLPGSRLQEIAQRPHAGKSIATQFQTETLPKNYVL
jgi:hypothetical protein